MIVCPSCAADHPIHIGPVSNAEFFAGTKLKKKIPGGSLYRCRICQLNFKFPLLSTREYDELYEKGKAKVWTSTDVRPDFNIIRDYIKSRLSGGSCLDIGCGAGLLLTGLPENFEKFGVEISIDAIRVAKSNGVKILGSNFSDLKNLKTSFDVVIATDVIEHNVDPGDFLSNCLDLAKPNGLIIITTGDSSSFLARLFGSRFWYYQFAEHISFVSRNWFNFVNSDRFDVEKSANFCYGSLSLKTWLKLAVRTSIYYLSDKTYKFLYTRRDKARRQTGDGAIPVPGIALTDDHLFIVLKKR